MKGVSRKTLFPHYFASIKDANIIEKKEKK
jgi:hypothetical protein